MEGLYIHGIVGMINFSLKQPKSTNRIAYPTRCEGRTSHLGSLEQRSASPARLRAANAERGRHSGAPGSPRGRTPGPCPPPGQRRSAPAAGSRTSTRSLTPPRRAGPRRATSRRRPGAPSTAEKPGSAAGPPLAAAELPAGAARQHRGKGNARRGGAGRAPPPGPASLPAGASSHQQHYASGGCSRPHLAAAPRTSAVRSGGTRRPGAEGPGGDPSAPTAAGGQGPNRAAGGRSFRALPGETDPSDRGLRPR